MSLLDIVADAYSSNIQKQREAYDGLSSRFYDALVTEIGHKLRSCGNRVPVVTGIAVFQAQLNNI